jgi:2-polyprenyl-3-methyl-5-hydroxy-6-metoxy-1,4-benzoquinol methylase
LERFSCKKAVWKGEGNVTRAKHVNDVELSDAETYFFQRCSEHGIVFDQLTNESKAICLALVSSANYIADMVAASHHDTHKTLSASESNPTSGTIKR